MGRCIAIVLFMITNVCLVISQTKNNREMIHEICFTNLDSKEWAELVLKPDVYTLSDIQNGKVSLSLSKDHTLSGTNNYVDVQRFVDNKWVNVNRPANEVQNSLLKILSGTTYFEHPFIIAYYFDKKELIPGTYRIVKTITKSISDNNTEDIKLSFLFRIVE